MLSALKAAQKGIGCVEPNPAVGCIIVKGNQIIGRGWHKHFGESHAEINALQDCKTLGMDPRDATMYVTLEPCCRYGKTPPCTDAIIRAGIARVVAATLDPSPDVNGKGLQQLRSAGIEVQTGLCEKQARLLNAPFIKFTRTGKCWVILKWAQTVNGKLAYPRQKNDRKWITNQLSRKDAHILRRRADVVLVGINTVLADDPLLTPRPGRKDRNTIRVILDTSLRTPLDCQLVKTAEKDPVLILTSRRTVDDLPEKIEAFKAKGIELLVFPDTPGVSNLHFLMVELEKKGAAQLLVEGGPTVLKSFLRENLADELCIYIAPKILGGQAGAGIDQVLNDWKCPEGGMQLHYVHTDSFNGDVRISGLTEKALKELSIPQ